MATSNLKMFVLLLKILLLPGIGLRLTSGVADSSPSVNSSFYKVLSAVKYPSVRFRPYDWRYFRVELPDEFSLLSIAVSTDTGNIKKSAFHNSSHAIPLLCIRSGAPPLPEPLVEFDLRSGATYKYGDNATNMGQCAWFKENTQFNIAQEQVSSDSLFLGIFNGVGPERTQSKMIRRGSTYALNVEMTVSGCTNAFRRGPFCNVSSTLLSCSNSNKRQLISKTINGLEWEQTRHDYDLQNDKKQLIFRNWRYVHKKDSEHMSKGSIKGTGFPVSKASYGRANFSFSIPQEYMLTCEYFDDTLCTNYNEWKFYSLEVKDISTLLEIHLEYRNTSYETQSQMEALFYVRYNAWPQRSSYDYLSQAARDSLFIPSPKIGMWHIGLYASKLTETHANESMQDEPFACFQLTWRLYTCCVGKNSENSKWNVHTLERVKKPGSSFPFESYYVPMNQEESFQSGIFPLEQLLSNSSMSNGTRDQWTFFIVEAPFGTSGGIMSVKVTSFSGGPVDLYAKFGSFPTLYDWDYHSTSSSMDTPILTANRSKERDTEAQNIEIVYPREGTWCLGLHQTLGPKNNSGSPTGTMSVLIQGCPKHCSMHGSCQHAYEESGLTLYSYCSCDRAHGGVDCSIELLSPTGHKFQSLFLIVSNVAAIFPALWSMHQRAYAEWIIYTTSGVSSAIYHSCDSGAWCALSFRVLQFMDFWLSFMAVVATFIYMSTMNEKTKISVHVAAAIITALIAANGPTRPINVLLVSVIGVVGLILGWITQFCGMDQISILQSYFNSALYPRLQALKRGILTLFRSLWKRFRWQWLCIGFLALGAAGTCWFMETGKTYWLWHSFWHIFIYTSSFFFLCSTVLDEPTVTENSLATYQPVSQSLQSTSPVGVRQTELAVDGRANFPHG